MNNSEYFTKIAETVKKKRTKGEYTVEEMRIYEEGKRVALKNVLRAMSEKNTYGQLLSKVENMKKFLETEKSRGKLATEEGVSDIWDSAYTWNSSELMKFVDLNVQDYRARLKKAREILKSQNTLLSNLQQMEIE